MTSGARRPGALGKVEELYQGNVRTHGVQSQSVGWKTRESQYLRFEKLAQVIEPEVAREGIRVLDWGCGYGEMLKYLRGLEGEGSLTLDRYYGYDISRDMLDAAASYGADGAAEWVQASDVEHDVDYAFVSGTFNVKFDESDEAWQSYVEESLSMLARRCRRGLAFNLLSTYVDWKEDHLFYGDPLHFFDLCKRRLSRAVTLLHDYPLYEWTIYVRFPEDGRRNP